MKKILQNIKRSIFHTFKLYPIYDVIKAINERFPLKEIKILESFAYTGELQTRAFKRYAAYLEAWEIDENFKPSLEKNLPGAIIKITNSFEEVLRCKEKFDFINVDTHQGIFGNYCENFEFFPLLFNVTKDECIVNLNVIPNAGQEWKAKYATLFNAEHLKRRARFYNTANPEHLTLEQMLNTYGEIAAKNGYSILWHYYQQRTLTYYLALHLRRK